MWNISHVWQLGFIVLKSSFYMFVSEASTILVQSSQTTAYIPILRLQHMLLQTYMLVHCKACKERKRIKY